jgi:hypothetical protein
MSQAYAQDPDPDKRPVEKPVQPPGEKLATQCPDGFTYNRDSRLCEDEPTLQCAEGLEETSDGSACILTETQTPRCPSGTHFDGNTQCLNDHNNEPSTTSPTCTSEGYTLQTLDGRLQCVKTSIVPATEPTCETGTLNEDTGKCEIKPTKGNNR